MVSCTTDAAWTCERVPKPSDAGAAANLGTVTISHNGIEFAAGRWLAPVDGRVQFLLFEQVPLVPGTYELGFELAGSGVPPDDPTHAGAIEDYSAAHNVDYVTSEAAMRSRMIQRLVGIQAAAAMAVVVVVPSPAWRPTDGSVVDGVCRQLRLRLRDADRCGDERGRGADRGR